MIRIGSRLATVAAAIILLPAVTASDRPQAPYPEGFRYWTHIKSAYVGKGSPSFDPFGTLHDIYANPRAMEGYRNGRFPAGSVLVFDVFEASSSDQGIEPGERKLVDIMWKKAGRGDGASQWLYGEFDRNSHTMRKVTTEQGVARCQSCHEKAGATGVFSKFRP